MVFFIMFDYLDLMRDGIKKHGPVRAGVYAMTGGGASFTEEEQHRHLQLLDPRPRVEGGDPLPVDARILRGQHPFETEGWLKKHMSPSPRTLPLAASRSTARLIPTLKTSSALDRLA